MGFTLVLAEKPSVARDIARVLNCSQKGKGYLAGSKYIVTWALGHLVTLADPEAYSEKYKTWRMEDLPMLPDKMKLVVIKQTGQQFKVVRDLLKRNDIEQMVIATDAGREGELVARWIIEKAGFHKPIKRLWISSQTERAVKEGFAKLRDAREYDNLYKSAQCRAEADWLVGLNVTRALTCKYNVQLSAGRVQTPTLAMIVEREKQIQSFVPKDYWTVSGRVNGFEIHWKDRKNGEERIFDKALAEGLVKRLAGKTAEVTQISKEAKQDPPPLAYDLTELQRDANRIYGFSAKKTLSLMQSLYEDHKLLTYPRTDSRYITEDIVPTLEERLKSVAVGPYAAMARELIRTKPNITKRLVDNSKVSDHHAIIPTEQFVNLGDLSQEERNIYDLVVKRFIAVLKPAFEFEQTDIKLDVDGELFTARGKIVKSLGWKSVYENQQTDEPEEEIDQSLPFINKGDRLKLLSVKYENKKTKPPERYTEATLLSAMEHPGKFIDDKMLRNVMDSTSGLGTPATRADIIEKLFDTFYVERKGKYIYPTSKGIQLIGLVPEDLKSPELTAKWEQTLQLISKGKADAAGFVKGMRDYASNMVSKVKSGNQIYRHDNLTREKCPDCGKYLLEVNGKKGKMLICPDRECGYRKGISRLSNARCPECHKRLELRGEGQNKVFVCSCGYKEKLDAFIKRRNEEKSSLSKKDVSKFLKKQNNDQLINSALAEALKKLKIDN